MGDISKCCENVFIGHTIAMKYEPSIYMTLNVAESLFDCKRFDGPNILSRHLYSYHLKQYDVGEITKYIYHGAVKRRPSGSVLTLDSFKFDQSVIDETAKAADKNCNGFTATCDPSHRSYPLAFCPYISDDDLFACSLQEASLTHYSPIAGQAAGIVNLICRSLAKNESWGDAVRSAFSVPYLHADIQAIFLRHHRWANLAVDTQPSYAPTALNAALHYVTTSNTVKGAMESAQAKEKFFCLPLIGILGGARWNIPSDMFSNKLNDKTLISVRAAAARLSELWASQIEIRN